MPSRLTIASKGWTRIKSRHVACGHVAINICASGIVDAGLEELLEANGLSQSELMGQGLQLVTHLEMFLHNYPKARREKCNA
jgi:hypothetical protein